MLVWLLNEFAPLLEQLEFYGSSGSRVLITARTALASLTSFLLSVICGPIAIRFLKRRFRERVVSASARLNELHASKNSTPTMGGIFLVGATLFSTMLWGDLNNPFIRMGLTLTLGLATIGAIDDGVKLTTTRNGISGRLKFGLQTIVAAVIGTWLFTELDRLGVGTGAVVPLSNVRWELGTLAVPWAVLVITGSSNAVNLTDGLDGLAAGCGLSAGAAILVICYLTGHAELSEYLRIPSVSGSGELCILLGSLLGAVLGFLWYNCYPAQVFMGDTGSLPIGGLLALGALVTRQELLLVVIGGVFVAETVSVIVQMGCYRVIGRKPLACSPLHNHFLFRGVHEIKITTRLWITGALLAVIALTTLKLR